MRPSLLYVASRWPYPVQSGRARMIAQTLEMASATHAVHVAAFAAPEAVAACRPAYLASAVALPRPSLAGSALSAARRPLAPLQAHLFDGRRAAAAIAELARAVGPSVAMLDMIRLAGYAPTLRRAAPGVRVVLDMDDLLSDRYAQMSGETGDILGAFASGMPGPVRRLAGAVPGALLGLERRLAARAEGLARHEMDAVVLVSPREAGVLAARNPGPAPVFDVPPTVPPVPARGRDFSAGMRFVFFGDETYAPNAQALLAFQGLAARLGPVPRPVRFEAAGRRDPRIETPDVRRLGFVEDLDAFLGPDAVLVAPIRTGTGIKTKLLDALARGVPVLTTPKGREGLNLEPGEDILTVPDAEAMLPVLRGIAAGAMDADLERVGLSGARRVSGDHAPERVSRNLALALSTGAAA